MSFATTKSPKMKSLRNPSLMFWVLIPTLNVLAGCTKGPPTNIPSACTNANTPCLHGKAFVEISTNRGKITLELNGDASPLTAGNFLDLVKRGVYKQTLFHRVIRTPMPFVVQGGDPFSKNPSTPQNNYGKGSFIEPSSGQARFIPLEIKLKGEELPRYNQLVINPNELTKLELNHNRGAISMARSQDIQSASAQFYISLRQLPELDGRYSVFGRVINGMNVIDSIRQGDVIIETKLITHKKF